MNTDEIFAKLKRRCAGRFLGVFARDRLPARLPPKRPLMLICNTDPHDKPGEHWIAMFLGENAKGEYFDSYGRDAPLIFKNFLNKFCTNWIRNDARLQSVISSFCGHYCAFYCLFKSLDYSMTRIVDCFTDDTSANDAMVHKFVCHNM